MLSHILITGGGESSSDFLGSEILTKSVLFGSERGRIFFGSQKKRQRDFLGSEKRTKGFFWVC